MRGFVIERNIKFASEFGGCLRPDAPEPSTQSNEVLVDVACAGLNFFDILQVEGKYQHQPAFPYVAGAEFSGVVSSDSPIPKGCTFKKGDRVFGVTQGAFAQRCAVDWRRVLPVPEGLSLEEAAGLYITFPTSYAALVYRAALKPGEWVLVHAGAGGVGLAAVQIAKALGAKVIATASTQEKRDVCMRFGADAAFGYEDDDDGGDAQARRKGKKSKGPTPKWQRQVMETTGGKGVDVIYDPVGMINASLKVIAWNGRAVVVGFAAGTIEKVPTNLLLLKNVSCTGVHWGAYLKNEPDKVPETWRALLEMLAKRQIRSVVYDKIYDGLEALPQGLADLGSRKTWGKAVVRIDAQDKARARL